VLAERVSTRTIGGLTGHSTCHKVVNFKGSDEMLGKVVEIKVTDIKANSLFGELN
jgi:tRNA-2-methylthio-N6-dimethylallyladenosine synthase